MKLKPIALALLTHPVAGVQRRLSASGITDR